MKKKILYTPTTMASTTIKAADQLNLTIEKIFSKARTIHS